MKKKKSIKKDISQLDISPAFSINSTISSSSTSENNEIFPNFSLNELFLLIMKKIFMKIYQKDW